MKILQNLRFRLNAFIKPRMIYGYTRFDGVYLANTRISNMTHIDTPQNLQIADNVWIGHFNMIDASAGLKIERGCQITNYVSLITHSSHQSMRLYGDQYLAQNGKPLVAYCKAASKIGAYTFIGAHSVIMPGVQIGKGSLISAFSYVAAGRYPDFSILRGQPAKVVGDTRNTDTKLLAEHPELADFYKEWAHE